MLDLETEICRNSAVRFLILSKQEILGMFHFINLPNNIQENKILFPVEFISKTVCMVSFCWYSASWSIVVVPLQSQHYEGIFLSTLQFYGLVCLFWHNKASLIFGRKLTIEPNPSKQKSVCFLLGHFQTCVTP